MRLPHDLTGFLIVNESQYRQQDDRSLQNANTVNTKDLQHIHTHTPDINDQMKNTPSLPTIIHSFPNSHIADHAKALLPVNNLSHPNVFNPMMPPAGHSHVFTVGKDVNPYGLTEDHFLEMLTALRMNSNLLIPYHRHISTVAFEINYNSAEMLTYKKVANRIKPVATTLPEKFCIVCHIPLSDPLAKLPVMLTWPPDFSPGSQYTEDQMKAQGVNPTGYLTDKEEKLIHHLIHVHEDSFTWTEEEKGKFSDDYFDPVVIPMVKHMPWVLKSIPIPPGKYNQIIRIIKDKIASGVYEPSNSSYHSCWFCIYKKDGEIIAYSTWPSAT